MDVSFFSHADGLKFVLPMVTATCHSSFSLRFCYIPRAILDPCPLESVAAWCMRMNPKKVLTHDPQESMYWQHDQHDLKF